MSDDESVRRLRAADPARGHESDLDSLRRSVQAKLDAPEEQQEVTRERDDLAERRRRRTRPVAWLAGAAAVLLVGVGGYAAGVGNSGSGGADGAAGDAAPESEVFTADAHDDSAAEPTAVEEEAVGDDATFVDGGLSDEGGTAEVFGYDSTGVATAERAEQVAQALGVIGTAQSEGSGWVVTDDAGRLVEVADDGVGSLRFADPTVELGACADVGGDVSSPDSLGTCAEGALTDPVATAQALVAELGIEPDTLDFVVDHTDASLAQVLGYPAGSTPVGTPAWTLTLTPHGVAELTGRLAPLTSLGDYDVIAPSTALERLTDPRYGAHAVGPQPSGPHTITQATPTLLTYSLDGGVNGVVPAWALSTDDGATWVVVALTDADLGI